MSDFPSALPNLTDLDGNLTLAANNHASRHNKVHQELSAVAAKVGVNSSAVTTSHDYKLSEVTGSDKAASKTYADNLPPSKTLSKTTYLNTNYFELLRTGTISPSSWLLLVVDVFNTYNTASTMEYARYKINIMTNVSNVPATLAMSKVYGDTLQVGVLTAVANSNGSISLWGRSATSMYRSTGITYQFAMQNTGAMVTCTYPLTSQVDAPTGTITLGVS